MGDFQLRNKYQQLNVNVWVWRDGYAVKNSLKEPEFGSHYSHCGSQTLMFQTQSTKKHSSGISEHHESIKHTYKYVGKIIRHI